MRDGSESVHVLTVVKSRAWPPNSRHVTDNFRTQTMLDVSGIEYCR